MVVAALGDMQGPADASRSGDTRRAQGVLRAGPSYQPRYSSMPAGEFGSLAFTPQLWLQEPAGTAERRNRETVREPLYRMHIDNVQCGDVSFIAGRYARWYGSYTGLAEGPQTTLAIDNLIGLIELHVYHRERAKNGNIAHALEATHTAFDVDIYLPPVFFRPSAMDYTRKRLDHGVSTAAVMAESTVSAIKDDSWQFVPLAEVPASLYADGVRKTSR
jgi:hypothetical protein